MALDNDWFTEEWDAQGSAISLKTLRKLHDEQSAYQRIEIYETETFGRLMTLDGLVMVTGRDNFIYHEMMAHPVLFTHADPKQVLIIGGGDCGTLREVLKHKGVEQVDQVEIDERVTRVAELYFPELCESNNDPRARLMFIDGIKWVYDAKDGSYDVIIIDSTDPVGPAEGLFSKPFYQQCMRVLAPNGLVIQQSESPLLHMQILKDMYGAIKGAGFIDALTFFFPQVSYPSGWWSTTMACKDTPVTDFREEAASNKTFPTRYYNTAIHRAAMAAPEFFYKEIGM